MNCSIKSESGLNGFDVLNYFAISAPAGTPPAIVNTLNAAINKMISSGEWAKSFSRNIGESGVEVPKPPQVTEQ